MPSTIQGVRDESVPEKKLVGGKRKSRGKGISSTQVQAMADEATAGQITGSGTTNYVQKRTGTSTIGDSQIRDDGSKVSIGIAPSSALGKLHVEVTSGDAIYGVGATGGGRGGRFSANATGAPALEANQGSTGAAQILTNTGGGQGVNVSTVRDGGTPTGYANVMANSGNAGVLDLNAGTNTSRDKPVLNVQGQSGVAEAIFCDGGFRRRARRVTAAFTINRTDNLINVYVTGTGAITIGTFGFSPTAADDGREWEIWDVANNAGTRNIRIDGLATGEWSDGLTSKTINAAGQGLAIRVVQTTAGTYRFHAARLARA